MPSLNPNPTILGVVRDGGKIGQQSDDDEYKIFSRSHDAKIDDGMYDDM